MNKAGGESSVFIDLIFKNRNKKNTQNGYQTKLK